jgi:hypothetical protein
VIADEMHEQLCVADIPTGAAIRNSVEVNRPFGIGALVPQHISETSRIFSVHSDLDTVRFQPQTHFDQPLRQTYVHVRLCVAPFGTDAQIGGRGIRSDDCCRVSESDSYTMRIVARYENVQVAVQGNRQA